MPVCIMTNWKNALKNENGITLLETIMSILILSVIMTMLPLVFIAVSAIEKSIDVEENFEWNLFLIQIRKEMKAADLIRGNSENRVILIIGDQRIYYEVHGTSIRRTVNGKGHEVTLQKINKARFAVEGETLVLAVDFINGKKEFARFSMLNFHEEG